MQQPADNMEKEYNRKWKTESDCSGEGGRILNCESKHIYGLSPDVQSQTQLGGQNIWLQSGKKSADIRQKTIESSWWRKVSFLISTLLLVLFRVIWGGDE
jgi:hypothetical protein